MEMDKYQFEAQKTAQYPLEYNLYYPALGLAAEAGEIANIIKKKMRGDGKIDEAKLVSEIGDALWYIQQIATDMHIRLDYIAQENLKKLKDRQLRGQIKGSGDNR